MQRGSINMSSTSRTLPGSCATNRAARLTEPFPPLATAATGGRERARTPRTGGPRSLDGVSGFMGLRWEDPQTVRLQIRPELINRGGLLSGWSPMRWSTTAWARRCGRRPPRGAHRDDQHLDQLHPDRHRGRGRLPTDAGPPQPHASAVMRSEVRHEDGRLLVTAIGSYSIFPPRALTTPAGGRHARRCRPRRSRPPSAPRSR